jgi:hypothetical protein
MGLDRRGGGVRPRWVANWSQEELLNHGKAVLERLDTGSRMKGDFHVRFCGSAGVRFPCATLPKLIDRTAGHRFAAKVCCVCGA